MSAHVSVTNHNGANLMDAHNQWAKRPADERFHSIEAARAYLKRLSERSVAKGVLASQLRVIPQGNEVMLVGQNGAPARLTNWSFGQVLGLANRRAPWMNEIPAELAARNIHDGLMQRSEDEELRVLVTLAGDEDRVVRAINGPRYSRYWDLQLLDFAEGLQGNGWHIPDARRPDGTTGPEVYAGDRDSFVMLVDDRHRIDDGSEGGLMKAFWASNSEVGAKSVTFWAGYLRRVCQNWILWGVQRAMTVRLRHVGDISDKAAYETQRLLTEWGNESPRAIEEQVSSLRDLRIAETLDDVIKRVTEKQLASAKAVKQAVELAQANPEDGDPMSVWGLAQGFTRLSQTGSSGYTDKRIEVDSAAARVLAAQW